MNNYEKIIELANKNNGYVTTKEIKAHGISCAFLTNLVKENKLERIDRGIYMLSTELVDIYYKLQIVNKDAVFSLATALYFHNLSDRIPIIIDITVPYNYSGSLLKNKNVSLNYVKKETLNLGVVEAKTNFGNRIFVYDIERTICDIVKNKDKMDAEIFTKAMQQYASLKTRNSIKLYKYAEILNVKEKLSEYMRILL
ncbi:MAG: type IV toxin-antitoxin system AbiEi family antitoxin domain-containing protein [Bacilli bacterium]|nr:type IV toxin-antitoxin system AbiEi family antitoxin domain-containing protein [Bacilli bacterium]MDD4734289.1 type IV toxin-antitoxin system AbiEi family antitoxin domain-containing protein [Bacilli bacterium]